MVRSNHVKLSRQREIALYNRVVPKQVIHISEAEAASNFADVLARVRAGAEIVIEGQEPVVVAVRPSKPQPGRLLSESIALAEAHGSTVTLDGDFGRDLEEIINSHREPLNPPTWD
jgi:antitoxin (DNA-binding transcriptional repressor) of toxin-antitoxin stability system